MSPRVVALGGGHGLAASLSALRHLTHDLTAIVTVADNGGSSGRLRRELGVLPPGDLRMALSALCDDGEWGRTWRDVMQHRFSSKGDLDQHAVGNLLIVALWELLGDPVRGLDWVGRLLGARGRVLPVSTVPMDIEADVEGLAGGDLVVRGQAEVATTPGLVTGIRLLPRDPPACPEAVEAVRSADLVVLGPGSWFTSVITHLLVPDLRDALVGGPGRVCLVLNLAAPYGETDGFSAADHVRVFQQHASGLAVDVVLADPRSVDDVSDLSAAVERLGGELVLRQVSSVTQPAQHDPLRLAAAFRDVFDRVLGDASHTGP
ncbi:MAG: uridine diphosphate-N-acetylglucosamine-binding protein YvcK [Actinomycetes bacterium]